MKLLQHNDSVKCQSGLVIVKLIFLNALLSACSVSASEATIVSLTNVLDKNRHPMVFHIPSKHFRSFEEIDGELRVANLIFPPQQRPQPGSELHATIPPKSNTKSLGVERNTLVSLGNRLGLESYKKLQSQFWGSMRRGQRHEDRYGLRRLVETRCKIVDGVQSKVPHDCIEWREYLASAESVAIEDVVIIRCRNLQYPQKSICSLGTTYHGAGLRISILYVDLEHWQDRLTYVKSMLTQFRVYGERK